MLYTADSAEIPPGATTVSEMVVCWSSSCGLMRKSYADFARMGAADFHDPLVSAFFRCAEGEYEGVKVDAG